MPNWKKCKAHNKNYDSEKYPDGCFLCTHPDAVEATKPATKKEAMDKKVSEIVKPNEEKICQPKHFEISSQAMMMLVCNANNCATEICAAGINREGVATTEKIKETFADLQGFILANSIAQAFKEAA